ncbi:unnamed protein product [Auanema sp. JU1783]|nr:unnamed protein product [Auanema sp. JU1783]
MSSSNSSGSDSENENTGAQNLFSGSGSESTPSHRSASPGVDLPPAERSDDDEESAVVRPTGRRLIDSSDEEGDEENTERKPDASALFGDDVSSDSGDDDAQGDARNVKKSESDNEKSDASQESIHGIRLYPDPDDEEQPEEEAPPEIIESVITSSILYYPEKQYYCKIPNFLSVETKPFDPDEYEENGEDDTTDNEGKSRLKLKVENTLRWRYSKDANGVELKESNAKMVRWSDGSMSLHLGNEIFDVQEMPVNAHTHLYVKHLSGLSGLSVFEKKLQFRPHSTDSKTHRKVTLNMADRTRKTGQVKMLTEVGVNPDEAKREAIKREEESLRAAMRKENQQRAARNRDRNRPLTSGFLEDTMYSDDEGRRRSRRGDDAPLIGVDSDDSDDGRRLDAAKDDSNSEDERNQRKSNTKKKIMSSDEDDSD